MSHKIALLFLLFLFTVYFTNAQEKSFLKIKDFSKFENCVIHEISQDQYNNIWLATNLGLLKFNGKTLENFDLKFGKSSKNIQTVFTKKDTIFIGKNKNLHLKTRNNLFTFKAKSVNKIFEYKNEYFIASNQGILHFRKDYLQPLKTTYNLDFSIVNDIIYHQNNFIVASSSGLWQLSSLINPKRINQISKGNFSSLTRVNTRLIALKNKKEIFELTQNNTIILRYVKQHISILKLIKNKLFIGFKNSGIEVLNASNFVFEKRINKYNSNLNSDAIKSIFEDIEGNVFVATKKELFIQKSSKKIKKPVLSFAGFSVNYKPLDSININDYKEPLQLKSNQNNIFLSLYAVSISTPNNIEFRYKLNGKFSPWNSNSQISFASLQPNNYIFTAQCRFINSNEIDTKEISFSIEKPFYQKIWFLPVLIGTVILFLTLTTLKYIQNIKKRNQKRVKDLEVQNHLLSLEQKALQLQMNPHFIFNVLNGIKAAGNSGKVDEMNATISQFSVLLRSVLHNSRLEEINLKEEIKTIKNYIELEQKMTKNPFKYQIKTFLNAIDMEEILIPSMLLQPFIENSIKHGIYNIKEGKIIIKFEIKNDFLNCSVEDNGKGFTNSNKTNATHKSVAINVNKERIENLAGKNSFTIKEIKEKEIIKGTRIWFKLPLKTDF